MTYYWTIPFLQIQNVQKSVSLAETEKYIGKELSKADGAG